MSSLLALYTSDPFLVRCELDRVSPHVSLASADDVAGVGAYDDGLVLLRRFGAQTPRADLWHAPESDVVLAQAQRLAPGLPPEENTQPFRFRQWLFAASGTFEAPEALRERLLERLPDFLQRVVKGGLPEEAVFGAFLARLRELGRTEDLSLEAPVAAQVLLHTARTVEDAAREAGVAQRPGFTLAATNGRVLVAARRGGAPLYLRLLEGEATCERCGLGAAAKDSDTLVRQHRQRRSVVFATHPLKASAWSEVEDGAAVAVDRKLSLQTLKG
ncbi:MAG: class II glutamine amidotransferase [Myxococcaceae bacterium]|nr:class II glutamine amidotransferase [Myxococcaceae bacterium]